jgi:hypothetical protein
MGYVLAVAKSHRVTASPAVGPQRVDQITAVLTRRAWNRQSAGEGAKGPREYDWAWVVITPPQDEQAGHHWLLVRRSRTDGELASYRCWSPTPVALPTLVRVAGTRWRIETTFQTAKNATGLDEHQVRRWDSWYRHTTLVMLAHAILTVIAARERARYSPADQALNSVDCQRNPPPVRQTGRQHRAHHRPLADLVALAPAPPSPRQDQPLPPPRPAASSSTVYITIPGWSTKWHWALRRAIRRFSGT